MSSYHPISQVVQPIPPEVDVGECGDGASLAVPQSAGAVQCRRELAQVGLLLEWGTEKFENRYEILKSSDKTEPPFRTFAIVPLSVLTSGKSISCSPNAPVPALLDPLLFKET